MSQPLSLAQNRSVLVQFFELCKPRVNALIVFTAVIGMLLAVPAGLPWDIRVMLVATLASMCIRLNQ